MGITPQADFSLENALDDKIHNGRSKDELWDIVERYTSEREIGIIKEIFINNQTMAEVAREQGIFFDRIRQIKEKGLRKLWTGRARRELLEKFDIVEAGAYRNRMNKFIEYGVIFMVDISLYAGQRYRQSIKNEKSR